MRKGLTRTGHPPNWSFISSRTLRDAKKGEGRLEEIERFKRSLRLVGLSTEDINLPPHLSLNNPNLRAVKPKVNTRIDRRTYSAEDLKTVVMSEDGSPGNPRGSTRSTPGRYRSEAELGVVGRRNDGKKNERTKSSGSGVKPRGGGMVRASSDPGHPEPSREIISKAVYEAWYFRKMEEARRVKEQAMQQEKLLQWQQEHDKREQLLRSRESYVEWLQKKAMQKMRSGNTPPSRPNQPKDVKKRPKVSPEDCAMAFTAWKREKDRKLAEMKAEEEKKKARPVDKEKKQEEAEKAFLSWKRKTDLKLREKKREQEAEEREKWLMEEKVKEEKEKEAQMSFKAWKEMKDRILKEKAERQRELKEKVEEAKEEASRIRKYESKQAFLEWLDSVDERITSDKRGH